MMNLYDLLVAYALEIPVYILGIVPALILAYFFILFSNNRQIKKDFNVSGRYFVFSGDIGGKGDYSKYYLKTKDLIGEADIIFSSFFKFSGVIGEFKSRKFHGKIKERELYQCTLYMGAAKESIGFWFVSGRIKYANTVVKVPFDKKLYKELIKMKYEMEKSIKTWEPVNPNPLSDR